MICEELKKVKGYYCNECGKFYAPHEVKKTYNIEVVGEGVNAKILKYEYAEKCPCGCREVEFEEFNPEWWTHLVAYIQATNTYRVTYKVPIYANDTDSLPLKFVYVKTADEVERIAGRLCVEIVSVKTDIFDFIDIEVDFV